MNLQRVGGWTECEERERMGAAKKKKEKTYLNNLHGQLQPLLNQADEQMTPVLLNELAKKTQNMSFCSRLNRSNDDSEESDI